MHHTQNHFIHTLLSKDAGLNAIEAISCPVHLCLSPQAQSQEDTHQKLKDRLQSPVLSERIFHGDIPSAQTRQEQS